MRPSQHILKESKPNRLCKPLDHSQSGQPPQPILEYDGKEQSYTLSNQDAFPRTYHSDNAHDIFATWVKIDVVDWPFGLFEEVLNGDDVYMGSCKVEDVAHKCVSCEQAFLGFPLDSGRGPSIGEGGSHDMDFVF